MRILTVSPPSRIVWIYAWTASRTSCERFPCDVLPFRNASISSRFSFSSRRVIRSFSSIRIPRLNYVNRYDEVIHHSAQFLACCAPYPGARYIYSLSIVIRRRTKGLHRASKPGVEWPRIFILYAIWKTARRRDERGAINAPIPREKLYENRPYVRAWPRSLMHAAVDGKSRRPAAPQDEAFYLDHGPGPSPVAPPSAVRKRGRTPSPACPRRPGASRNRATCGRSRQSGNPCGSGNRYMSRARTPVGRNGTPTCRIRT